MTDEELRANPAVEQEWDIQWGNFSVCWRSVKNVILS